MKLIWAVILTVVLLQAASAAKKKKNKTNNGMVSTAANPVDVSYLYGNKTCNNGKFPRVMNTGGCRNSKTPKAIARCLPCVREDTDAICNANGFLRAFLTKGKSPFNCDLSTNDAVADEDKINCPLGSECVSNPDSSGHGICCYGDLAGESSNGDTVCSKCRKACDSLTETCQQVVTGCGRLSYACVSNST